MKVSYFPTVTAMDLKPMHHLVCVIPTSLRGSCITYHLTSRLTSDSAHIFISLVMIKYKELEPGKVLQLGPSCLQRCYFDVVWLLITPQLSLVAHA